jgi:hypothetical protein
MAKPIHPETYLRREYERMFLEAPQAQVVAAPVMAGRALVAAGVLPAETAEEIGREYRMALGLREGGRRFPLWRGDRDGGQRQPLSAARAVVGDFVVGDPSDQLLLHQVIFADDASYLDLSGRVGSHPMPTGGPPARRLPPARTVAWAGGPHMQSFFVVDDQRTRATATCGRNSSTDRSWQGTFSTDRPLSPTTEWIAIDGHRVRLPPPAPPPAVRVEELEAGSGIQAALFAELAAALSGRGGDPYIEPAEQALVATGALAPDDPILCSVQDVAAALAGQRPFAALAEPWASLLKRWGRTDGRRGRLAIGAAVGPVAGYSLRFDSLDSDGTGFSVHLATSPGNALGHGLPFRGGLLPPFQWWAEDDRGNAYLGSEQGHSSTPDLAQGQLRFSGPLDPKAQELLLVPRGRDQRAVVTVSLEGLGGRA